MPADLFRRVDGTWRVNPDYIYLPFFERVAHALAAARARGQDYMPTRGWDSWARQHQLRMLFLTGKGGRAAPAGYSAHQYGLALDFAPDGDPTKPGLQPVWDDAHFTILGEEVQRVGLVWGASFDDKPHVQWPGFVNAHQLEPLRTKWQESAGSDLERLKAVWDLVTRTPTNLPALNA